MTIFTHGDSPCVTGYSRTARLMNGWWRRSSWCLNGKPSNPERRSGKRAQQHIAGDNVSKYLGGGPQSVWARGAQFLLVLGVWVPAVIIGERGDGPGFTRFAVGFVAATAAAAVLHRRGRPTQSLPTRSDDVAVVGSAASVSVVGAGLLAMVLDHRVSAVVLVCGWTASFLGLLLLRGIIRQLFRRTNGQRVAVVGVGEDAHEVTGLILDHPEVNLEFVGVIGDLTTAERNGLDKLWLGPIDRLGELLAMHEVDVAMVTTTGFRSSQFRHILGVLRQSGVEPMLSTGVARLDSGSLRVSSVVHEPLVSIAWSEPSKVVPRRQASHRHRRRRHRAACWPVRSCSPLPS